MNNTKSKTFPQRKFFNRRTLFLRLVFAVFLQTVLVHVALAIEVDARLDWSKRVELAFPVNGVVAGVHAGHGDRVNKGEILVFLDPREFNTAVNRAQAAVKSQQELKLEATREVERAEELYERTVLSDHELQTTRIALETATARLEAARAELSQAQLAKERSELRAPFAAIVVSQNVEVGETIVSSMQARTLVVLAEQGRMLARASVSAGQLELLKIGDAATVVVGKRRISGSVLQIGLEPIGSESGKPLYEVVCQFATDGVTLRKGQQVRLELP